MPGSSIFTAEIVAIKQALDVLYKLDTAPKDVVVFSDSKAAILAINSYGTPPNHHIAEIQDLHRCLKSNFTKVTFAWIPSHTGIYGNDMADKLAVKECIAPTGMLLQTN